MTRFIKIYLKACETVMVNVDRISSIKWNPALINPSIIIAADGQVFEKVFSDVGVATEKNTALNRWLEDSNEEPIFHLY